MLKRLLLIVLFAALVTSAYCQRKQLFNNGWQFIKDIDTTFSTTLLQPANQAQKWEKVSLPHTAKIEPIEKVAQQWQGTCFYRKFFMVANTDKGKHIAIQFDAAMHEADVYLNGQYVYKHLGGYLPFYIDISDKVMFGKQNSILVKLNNEDNPTIPPGKPIKDLDFNYYSGLYRNVWLIKKDKLHISNAVAASRKAGGGIFVHCESVNTNSAKMVVQTEVKNDWETNEKVQVRITLTGKSGNVAAKAISASQLIYKGYFETFAQTITIANPALWSPDEPNLYRLKVEVLHNGKVTDNETITAGIKDMYFKSGALFLNNKKIIIRGTNRHQEYPYIGYAVSDNAQFRDAYKIKDAGFNFVRCSHYPPSPAFLDACDVLGILVMDAIPGWQFPGDTAFQKNSFQNIRDMIRRDRNHPSIILWEASLNESDMKKDYMQMAHKIVHEELPFQNIYSAGWLNEEYDVFLPARQHAKAPDYWKKYAGERPMIIAEYGDWEYYAQNAGFNQKAYQDLKAEERTSRQLRSAGEKGMLQQALNFQEAHNDNLYGIAAGDANWLMFDYKRGYAADLESSGIMDITRLPKFSFYFYQSLADATLTSTSDFKKARLFIANYWNSQNDTVVKIYSNCDEVELQVNGKKVIRQKPDKDAFSTNLAHPPFTFHIPAFTPGSLIATGYIGNTKAVQQTQKTPGSPVAISLRADLSGKQLTAGDNDVVFVYANITDAFGTVIPDATYKITFAVTGAGKIVGPKTVSAEAGTATILVKGGDTAGQIKITASAENLKSGSVILVSSRSIPSQ